MATTSSDREVIGGVDTHGNTHHAAAIDAGTGKLLGDSEFPATSKGYRQLLAWLTGAYLDTWLQVKFVLVILLSGYHGFLVGCWRAFAEDRNTRSQKFYRIINEVPAVLMIFIVILAVVKPFS